MLPSSIFIVKRLLFFALAAFQLLFYFSSFKHSPFSFNSGLTYLFHCAIHLPLKTQQLSNSHAGWLTQFKSSIQILFLCCRQKLSSFFNFLSLNCKTFYEMLLFYFSLWDVIPYSKMAKIDFKNMFVSFSIFSFFIFRNCNWWR